LNTIFKILPCVVLTIIIKLNILIVKIIHKCETVKWDETNEVLKTMKKEKQKREILEINSTKKNDTRNIIGGW
jgi:hypothetical protein